MSDEIVDSGLGGGCMFEFAYEQDELQEIVGPPRLYQRCEILAGDKIHGGLIVGVAPAKIDGEEVEKTWIIRIAADRDSARQVAAAVGDSSVAVRVLG